LRPIDFGKAADMSDMSVSTYSYARDDLLDNRNTYFYTEYQGAGFIKNWRASRLKVLNILPPTIAPMPAGAFDPNSPLTRNLIEQAIAGNEILAEKFIAKFEITKRIHGAYDEKFKALDREDHKDLDLYLRAADLFVELYCSGKSSRLLNVYLKCLDTLVGLHESINAGSAGRLAWHIESEQQIISRLIKKLDLQL
jgi:hypothetical protein